MPIDSRRETQHIQRELVRYHNQVGESVIWFRFDVINSHYDSVYDEGGRMYRIGINVPTLWIDQGEAPEQYLPEGRRPVVTLRFAVWARALTEVHVGVEEAHGHREWDAGLINGKWFDDRLNDILYYDGRYWEVNTFSIRGRLREDTIVGITCTETYPEDEFVFDFPPGTTPLEPPIPPVIGVYGGGQYGEGPYGG